MGIIQIIIILAISLLGRLISDLISFPLPETIISSIILFLLFEFKILKVEFFKEMIQICRKYLAFFFLPVGVGIMTQFGTRPVIDYFKVLFVMVLSTFIVMLLTGKFADIIIGIQEKIIGNQKSEITKVEEDRNE
ncbi:MAG: CidA/LrgA family protein [Fusobacterium sp.]|nr:CidA/LrgA family protein [Fusobacterium sp.]